MTSHNQRGIDGPLFYDRIRRENDISMYPAEKLEAIKTDLLLSKMDFAPDRVLPWEPLRPLVRLGEWYNKLEMYYEKRRRYYDAFQREYDEPRDQGQMDSSAA